MAISEEEITAPTGDSEPRVAGSDQPSMEERSVPVLTTTDSFDLSPVQEQDLILNMGPQHPSTHGVARILLELDGEVVRKAIPDVGYLHRGIEKIGEYRQYNQFVPWTDRMDYIAAFTSNLAWVQTVEDMMGLEIPPRAKYLRIIFSELQPSPVTACGWARTSCTWGR